MATVFVVLLEVTNRENESSLHRQHQLGCQAEKHFP
jgi:hypothetical protein